MRDVSCSQWGLAKSSSPAGLFTVASHTVSVFSG